ncbi:hemerythrin domain-containing protein [Nocardioides panaciterrulae]|uniref:Hemerythrin-like domain-containing protein n=1 Tax=Nocardioides panaciterrulae TaxID=661492 RepID=A0A7Y9E5E5_9ACTN|nr:hemerythrin domain-containing protein [Nocardioides panaciterrulae]NYD41252.1 hypothetical protein [Nocardioides panaciterrulae]
MTATPDRARPARATARTPAWATGRTTGRPVPHPAWPRQLQLPGQAAAPEGPVDLATMFLMHHAFRRDLAAFAQAVPHTPLEDRAAWLALLRRWEVFAGALHHHHRGEDTWLWPALLERADRDEQAVLAAMEAEHGEIDPLLEASRRGLALLASGRGRPDDRAALGVRLCAARESLARHLAHEERDALPILQRRLSAEEWRDLEVRFADGLRPRDLLDLVPWAVQGLPEDGLREFRRRAGWAHRVVWRLTRRRFERLDRRAFRHLPPGPQNACR